MGKLRIRIRTQIIEGGRNQRSFEMIDGMLGNAWKESSIGIQRKIVREEKYLLAG